jgi:hypothetical protein
MKNILAKVAIVACLFSSGAYASSSLDIIDESSVQYKTVSFTSGLSGFKKNLSFVYGVLSATGAGSVTYTYLGSSATYTDSFLAWNDSSSSSFWNRKSDTNLATKVGSTFTQDVESGILGFSFSTKSPSYTVTDAQNLQTNDKGAYGANEGVFGIASAVSVDKTSYQYVLIYNDPVKKGDRDYNDLVVGVNFTPAVPEPETYAMLLAGLGLMGTIARRRKQA